MAIDETKILDQVLTMENLAKGLVRVASELREGLSSGTGRGPRKGRVTTEQKARVLARRQKTMMKN